MRSNLIISGGIYHEFDQTSQILSDILEACGFDTCVKTVADGLDELTSNSFDLLTINALAFTMTQHPKYEPLRDDFAFKTNMKLKKAILGHLNGGGRILGIHTAAICFDDWPEWGEILGAKWVWGKSWHPAPCQINVSGVENFSTVDELYFDLEVSSEAVVLAEGNTNANRNAQPVLIKKDRSAYLTLGHDIQAFKSNGINALIVKAINELGNDR